MELFRILEPQGSEGGGGGSPVKGLNITNLENNKIVFGVLIKNLKVYQNLS
jgi:hypothetical protein